MPHFERTINIFADDRRAVEAAEDCADAKEQRHTGWAGRSLWPSIHRVSCSFVQGEPCNRSRPTPFVLINGH